MSSMAITGMAILAVLLGGIVGWILNDRFGSKSVEAMRKRVDEGLRAGRREAEKIKRKATLDSREEILRQRDKADRDLRSRKGQLTKREKDVKTMADEVAGREGELRAERDSLAEVETGLKALATQIDLERKQIDQLVEETNDQLELSSGLTRDEATRQLKDNLRAEVRLESAGMIKQIKDEARKDGDREAARILTMAVERAASEFSAERTTSTFDLAKGSDLKGRIIGQEGKNIRAFEAATGIQLLLDDETNTVTLSGYNPVNREIARRVLETLVKDGNIHPRRIEDLTRRKRKRLDEEMRRSGQEVLKEMKIKGLNPEMVKMLGRLKYRTSYGQNVLQHSKEVAYLTGMLAAELRLDEKLARRAGLLHDIGKAIDYEVEGTHPEIGAEVAERCGEHPIVVNAIASHHEDCEVISPISVLVSAADSLSGARPGARRKTVAEYIKRIEMLEEMANGMKGVEQSYAIQAGREVRVIARSKETDDAKVDLIASDLVARIESEMDYPGRIKVTVIRELRAVEVAR